MFDHLTRENLHHAYVCIGEPSELVSDVSFLIEKISGAPVEGNPDIWWWKGESFLVDDARALSVRQSGESMGDSGRRYFVLEMGSANEAAQNALLKTFEEPRKGNHFFVIAPSAHQFLPTLLSRVVVLTQRRDFSVGSAEIELFLKSPLAKRNEILKPLLKKTDDPEEKREQKRRANEFIIALERLLERKLPDPRAYAALREIELVRSYITDAAGNARLILEHLALTV